MNWWNSLVARLSQASRSLLNIGSGGPAGSIGDAVHGLQQTANALQYVVTHPLSDLTNTVAGFAAAITGNHIALVNAGQRFFGFSQHKQVNPLITWIQKQLNLLWAADSRLRAWVFKLVWLAVATAKVYTDDLVSAERKARINADNQLRAFTLAQIKALHTTIEREAASGYSNGYNARVSVITRLLDYAAIRQPAVRALTGRIVGLTLDLVAVDNPAARLLAGFLISHVINRLGIDKAIGSLIDDLLGPLLGNPKPHDLNSVMTQISGRLGAGEQRWADFMADGGPQILQAGQLWRDLTTLTFDAGMFAFAVAAARAPAATARDVSAIIRPVGTNLIAETARLIGEG